MPSKSAISWTDFTRNYVVGCSMPPGSPECTNCYAIEMADRIVRMQRKNNPAISQRYAGLTELKQLRNGGTFLDWTGVVRVVPSVLEQVWDVSKRARPLPYRNFWCSMGDIFHESLDWDVWEPALTCWEGTDWQVHQVLTKRPDVMWSIFRSYTDYRSDNPLPPHIWCMTTVGHPSTVFRLDILLEVPATTRGLSVEPLLADLAPALETYTRYRWEPRSRGGRELVHADRASSQSTPFVDWIILGGESEACGREARLTEEIWIRRMIELADRAGVAIWMKQTGKLLAKQLGLKHPDGADLAEWPSWMRRQEHPAYLAARL